MILLYSEYRIPVIGERYFYKKIQIQRVCVAVQFGLLSIELIAAIPITMKDDFIEWFEKWLSFIKQIPSSFVGYSYLRPRILMNISKAFGSPVILNY